MGNPEVAGRNLCEMVEGLKEMRQGVCVDGSWGRCEIRRVALLLDGPDEFWGPGWVSQAHMTPTPRSILGAR